MLKVDNCKVYVKVLCQALNFRVKRELFFNGYQSFLRYLYCWEFIAALGILMEVLSVLLVQSLLLMEADVMFNFSCFNQYCDSNTDCRNM